MKTLISTVQGVVVILSFAAIGMMQNPAVDGYASHANGAVTPDNDSYLELVGSLDMTADEITIQGNYAYVGAANKLSIIDIRDKTAPFVVAEIEDLPGISINDIEVSDDYLYIANGQGGLRIFNVSDPQSPLEAGFVANSEYFNDVLLSGDYAYVATDRGTPSGTLIIIDIKDPIAPYVIGSAVDTMGVLYKLAISGKYVYACSDLPHFGWLVVFDVTNPSSPSIVGRSDNLPGQIVDIELVDNYAYATIVGTCMGYDCEGEGLYILDISNSSLPYIVNSYDMFPWRIETIENTAFVLGKGGLHVLDISNQTSPVEVDTYDLGDSIRNDFARDEPYLYVANGDGGFLILLFGAAPQSSDSGTIAYIGSDNNIWIIQENDSPEQITLDGNYSEPSWSPDGTQIAFVQIFTADNGKEAYQIGIVDPANFTEKVIVEPEKTPFALLDEYYRYWNVRWSPDGKSLLYIASDGRVQGDWVQKFNLETNQPVSKFVGFFSRGFDVSFADGAIVSKDFTNMEPLGDGLYLYSAQGGNTEQVILPVGKGGVYYQPQWSPDSEIIGYINRDRQSNEYTLASIEPDGNQQNTLYTHRNGSIENFSWSPDGNKVVIETEGSLQIIDLGTQNADELVSGTQPDWSGHFSPDEDIDPIPTETPPPQPATGVIAFVGQDRNIWLINPGDDNPSQLTTDAYISDNRGEIGVSYQNIKWSPDGSLLGATKISPEGHSIVVIPSTRESMRTLLSGIEGSFDWLPDGKTIIYATGPDDESQPSGLALLDIESSKITPFIDPPTDQSLSRPDWTDTGDRVFFYVDSFPFNYNYMSITTLGISGALGGEFTPINIASDCDWRPMGDQLICREGVGEIFYSPLIVFSASGEKLGYIPDETGEVKLGSPRWSPDGNYLAYWRSDSETQSLEIVQVNGLEANLVYMTEGNYDPLDWSPDSKTLLVTNNQNQLSIIDVSSGNITPLSTSVPLTPLREAVWRPNSLHPASVTDLEVHPGQDARQVILKCSNPNSPDPGFSIAKEYEFRYSKEPITEENWDAAEMTGAAPAPDDMTYLEGWTVPRQFDLNTRWYFGVKTVDENGNKSEISNVAWIIDTGFRPQIDGFCFSNTDGFHQCSSSTDNWGQYPTPPSNIDFTYQDALKMLSNGTFDDLLIASWYYIAGQGDKIPKGGKCFGMSAAAQILYWGDEFPEDISQARGEKDKQPSDLQAGANATAELMLSNTRRYITYLEAHHATNPIRSFINQSMREKPSMLLKELQTYLTAQHPEQVMLALNPIPSKGDTGDGHGLTPISIEYSYGDEIWIRVYDSNWPNDFSRLLKVNIALDQWSYFVTPTLPWGSTDHRLGLLPLSLFAQNPQLATIVSDIWFVGNGHLLITNDQKQETGYKDGEYINTIPDASFERYSDFADRGAVQLYSIPESGDYTFLLTSDQISDTVSIVQLDEKSSVNFESIPVSHDTQDIILIAAGGTEITYQSNETKSFSFFTAVGNKEKSVGFKFQLQNIDISKGDVISINTALNQGLFSFDNSNASGGVYDFSLTRIDQSGEEQVTYPDIAIAAHETHVFDFSSRDLDEIVLKIDQNSDGEYEIERNLGMQSRAEKPTSTPPAEPPQETTIPVIVLAGLGLVAVGILVLGIGALGLILYRKN